MNNVQTSHNHPQNETNRVLVVAEKPSVAQSIATVLNAKRHKDYFQGGGYIVSWCVGHLIALANADAYDEKYLKWRYTDLPILPEKWQYTVSPETRKQYNVLSELMKRPDIDTVVCATDAGREGELIFRLVYQQCHCRKPIKRLWISSMEESAIREGFHNLKSGTDYDNLYQAALCRERADWLVGINITRLFSTLYGQTLRVGRVQTPTLAMIVDRATAIQQFRPQPFYTPELTLNDFTVAGQKTKDKEAAQRICVACSHETARVLTAERQEKSTAPPKLYDLTTLQREANRQFGYTAKETLTHVQSLYEKKLTTYPRTDSRFLTTDMAGTIPALIACVQTALPFVGTSDISIHVAQVVNDAKVSDHHAIIPTQSIGKTEISALPMGERNLLQMISVRLLCAVTVPHTYAETCVTVGCGGHEFTAKGKTDLDLGWKTIEQAYKATLKQKADKKEVEVSLPVLSVGQAFQAEPSIREGVTTPPKAFTEDTLLAAMETAGDFSAVPDVERKGLGTPATRADIIEKLVSSMVVERKDKALVPTEGAFLLLGVLPEVVKSPQLTAEWEEKLKQVERGQLSSSAFMLGIEQVVIGLVKAHNAPDLQKVALFPPRERKNKGESLGHCPRCGGSVYEGTKGFFCDNRACEFALWKENKLFTAVKKEMTGAIVKALLKDGRIAMTGLVSVRTGKSFDATIAMKDTGGKWVNLELEFGKGK